MSREQEVKDAIERFVSRVRQETDTQLEALSTELLAIAQGDIRTSRADVERAAVEIARAVAKGGSHARHDLISRVVVAMRRLDEATSIRGILDALANGAAEEASRVAVLLVDQAILRGYKHHGFAPGVAPAELGLGASPLLASAINLRQATVVRPVSDESSQQIPAFMRVAAGQMGLITPLVVANAVVALVYAEGPDRLGEAPGVAVWSDQVEVLVRHASARLENVTSKRTVEVLANQP